MKCKNCGSTNFKHGKFAWRYDTLLDKIERRKGNLCLDCYALYWLGTGMTTKQELGRLNVAAELLSADNNAMMHSLIEKYKEQPHYTDLRKKEVEVPLIEEIYLTDQEVVNHDKPTWQERYDDFMIRLNSIIEIYV